MAKRDRRRKSLRKTERYLGAFIRFRAREIFDAPVTYGDVQYGEVHVIASPEDCALSLHPVDVAVRNALGFHSAWDLRTPLREQRVVEEVERLVTLAKEGTLVGLHPAGLVIQSPFARCLF